MTDTTMPSDFGPSDAPLTRDTACIRCSYNLVGLRPSGVCPECGTPVEESTRGFFLRYAAPEYIQKLRQGLSLILNGILLMVVLMVAMMIAMFALASGGGAPSNTVVGLMQLVMLIPSGMMLLGYWKYTEPDPGFVGQEDPHAARKVLRASTVASAVLTLINSVLAFVGESVNLGAAVGSGAAIGFWGLIGILLALIGLVVWVAQYLSAMKYTGWVASRLPDTAIQKKAQTYMWLLPVIYIVGIACIGLGPLIALVLYWNLLDRVRKQVSAIVPGTPPVAA